MKPDPGALETILMSCDAGEISPSVALMQLLIETEDADLVARFVRDEAARFHVGSDLARLLDTKRAGIVRIASMLQGDMDRPPLNATVEEGIEFCRRLFDWSVEQSEEASVALYSLGDPELLQAATDEIVNWLGTKGLLGTGRDGLDLGCGIGRLSSALAPRLRSVMGVDVSPRMIERAQKRCRALPNVRFTLGSGRDLADFTGASFDLVLAVDVFPYLVQSALALAETHIAEGARVLRSRGDLVILNFSYRDDRTQDEKDVARFASSHGFQMQECEIRPFNTWNGVAFHLQRGEARP
jgi:cyclopropane fatty-acyl-phospholipid synthase-like methyltransferase